MKQVGNWDNPNERGKRDRIWLSRTEYWEMDYFIEHFIELRKYAKSDENRKKIRDAINEYKGQTPIKRDEMLAHLNAKWPPQKP